MSAAGSRRVCLGMIAAAHGIRGEVKIRSFTADPGDIASYGELELEDGSRRFAVERLRPGKDCMIATLSGVADRNDAEGLRGQKLYVPRERLGDTADEDEFFLVDLIGLECRRPGGETFGKVVGVENFGAGDLLEIRPEGGGETFYVSFSKAFVPEVDVNGGFVTVVADEA
jgi:16S rRNA processing protein RimM